MNNELLEVFCNGGHRYSTNCTDDNQGKIVHDYINDINDKIINNYSARLYTIFNTCLKSTIWPLFTTCGWKLIEKAEEFSYNKHLSYFIVSKAGISWDLSSHFYKESIPILGAAFLGNLVEHATSCSLWIKESSGCVTTICQGNACNFAWGRSRMVDVEKQTSLHLHILTTRIVQSYLWMRMFAKSC